MDLSLVDLQAALQAAQEEKSLARLSERNIVELINKVQELGLLGSELLHSINGREYLTKERLNDEVKEALDQAGGRVAVVELPALLGVDLVHCDAAAAKAVSERDDTVNIQGELMTSAYLDSMASEADQLLQEAGMISMGELARRYKLSTDFVHGLIEQRMGTFVNGRLHSGQIFTAAYVSRIKSQLRGALRGALRPVAMQSLLQSLGLDAAGSQGVPVSTLVEELVNEGSLRGTLKAGVWVPDAHARAQRQAVLSFYHQNQYIGYDMLAKLGVAGDPLEYIYPLLPEGLALSTAFVDPSLLEQVEAAAEEALVDSSWVDVQPLLPSALNSADAGLLLAECPTVESLGTGKKAEGQVLAVTCLVSRELMEELTQRACSEAQSLAAAALQDRKSSAAVASSSAAQADQAPAKTGKSAAAASAGNDSDDDDWDTGGKGGAKKKKGAKRRGGAGPSKAKGQGASQAARQNAPDPAAAHRGRLAGEALAGRLLEWVPDMEACGEDSGLAAAIADELRGPAQAAFDAAMNAVFTAGAEARRRQREVCQADLSTAWAQLQAHAHGLLGMAGMQRADEVAHAALERHVVRTHALRATDCLLRLLLVDVQEDAEGGEVPSTLSAGERVGILNMLAPNVEPMARAAVDKANGPSIQEAMCALETLAEHTGARLRKLERKAQKALLSSHAQALKTQLTRESDPAGALSLTVPLLIAQKLGVVASIPGRALAPAIGLLEKELDKDSHHLLLDYQKSVVLTLKMQGCADDVQASQTQLEVQLPALKAIVGIVVPNLQTDPNPVS